MDPPRAEPSLRDGDRHRARQNVGGWHHNVVELNLAVPMLVSNPSMGRHPQDAYPVHSSAQDHRLLLVSGSARIRLTHDDENAHRGSAAPVIHHLRPLMTNSSPRDSIRV